MEKKYKYMVATKCMTYNHAKYIEETLRGFAIQEATFPVIYLIIDDASTDGEQNILRQWAAKYLKPTDNDILWQMLPYGAQALAPLKRNPNAMFLILLLNENHYQNGRDTLKSTYIVDWENESKYQAICEGDDFWIRSDKLQKQVDFLENHPDYSMCFHNAVITYDDSATPAEIFNNICENREVTLEELIAKWINPTASIVYRKDIPPLFPVKGKYVSGDWRLTLHCTVNGKVWGMKDVMSFYRMTFHSSSIQSSYVGKASKMVSQKATILESLDEYTHRKYHKLLKKYICRFKHEAHFLEVKEKRGKLIAYLATPKYAFQKIKDKLK